MTPNSFVVASSKKLHKPNTALSDLREFLGFLTRTVDVLNSAAATLSEKQLARPPCKGSWSLCEILAHIRACDRVWSNSIVLMLALKTPSITDIHPNQFLKAAKWDRLPFKQSLVAFEAERGGFIELISGLREKELLRDGRIKGRTHTVASQIRRMALHELRHHTQISRTCSAVRGKGR